MPIIQPGILPAPPVTPRFGDYLGEGFASGTEKGIDLLLQAILKGQLGQIPTQGRYVAPSGQGTFLSPAEQVAQNPTMTLSDALKYARPTGSQFKPSGMRTGILPDLIRTLQQSEITRNLASAKALSTPMPAYRLDASGNAVPIMTSEGQPVSSKTKIVGAGTTTSQQDITDVVQGIKNGAIPPNPQELSYRDKTRVRAELARQGINLSKLETDWNVIQTYAKNSNATQQIRMRQALESVGQSVENLRALSQEFSRTGWTPANAVMVKAALTGTDPTRRDQATRFLTQITVMRDELAQGFMAGGVPTDRALQMAQEVINPLYGAKQMEAALDELNTNLAIRSNAINSVNPISMGRMSQQYQGMMEGQGNQGGGQTQPGPSPQSGVLHVDAKGNKAYVFPDGHYEEVP